MRVCCTLQAKSWSSCTSRRSCTLHIWFEHISFKEEQTLQLLCLSLSVQCCLSNLVHGADLVGGVPQHEFPQQIINFTLGQEGVSGGPNLTLPSFWKIGDFGVSPSPQLLRTHSALHLSSAEMCRILHTMHQSCPRDSSCLCIVPPVLCRIPSNSPPRIL